MDFSSQNLQGRNFKGQDLTGANFSYADIRGANFSNAIVRQANFTGAKAGLHDRWVWFQQMLVLATPFIAGALLGFSSWLVAYSLTVVGIDDIVSRVTVLIITIASIVAIVRQGFTISALKTIAGIGAVTGTVAAAVAGSNVLTGAVTGAVTGVVIGVYTVIGAATSVGAVSIGALGVAIFPQVIVFVADQVSETLADAVAVTEPITFVIALGSGFVTLIGLGSYAAWRAVKGDEKFARVRLMLLALSGIGSTTFRGADLTGANFSAASLASTNFSGANLTCVCWTNAKRAPLLEFRQQYRLE
jgi:hypothetical protein